MPDQFTLGIEEEGQIVAPHTREWPSHISRHHLIGTPAALVSQNQPTTVASNAN
jgi:hypothetical protein